MQDHFNNWAALINQLYIYLSLHVCVGTDDFTILCSLQNVYLPDTGFQSLICCGIKFLKELKLDFHLRVMMHESKLGLQPKF
jgi:hypothetical protein